MSTYLVPTIVVVCIVAAIAYGYWWSAFGDGKRIREQEGRDADDRAKRLRARGWVYEAIETGDIKYRVRGVTEGGVAWELHYDTDHSSSSSNAELIFRAPTLARGTRVWHIDDRPSFEMARGRVVKTIISRLGNLVGQFSDQLKAKTAFFESAREIPAGGSAFRKRYVVVAAEDRWAGLINFETERMILNWPTYKSSMSRPDNAFSAGLEPDGLRIKLFVDAPSLAVIEHVIRLGQALTEKSTDLLR